MSAQHDRETRKPDWLKIRLPAGAAYRATDRLLDEMTLHTVCEEARCPNKGECFSAGTATFLILGDECSRHCAFCSVMHGAPCEPPDPDEPRRVAEAAARLGLTHVVITSVTRDDLDDGGSHHFAAVTAALRVAVSGAGHARHETPSNKVDGAPVGASNAAVELLVPDFRGEEAALKIVLEARPEVLGHNLETVPRLYPYARPQAQYERSLELLRRAACHRPRPLVKTGLMVGLGETAGEVDRVLHDCAAAGVDLVTIGQYLRPSRHCLQVTRYVTPDEFERLRTRGASLGLTVIAAPFVRSSYHAAEALRAATA